MPALLPRLTVRERVSAVEHAGYRDVSRLAPERGPMPDQKLQEKLIDYIEDAHAMEQNVLQLLESMIATTHDDEILADLEQHKMETERHEQLLRERLQALGRGASLRKVTQSLAGALFKGVADQIRGDKPGKNARDAFVTEHMEIASYELLERLATRAADEETAEIARRNRADEQAMAQRIAANWDKFVDLTLAEEGVKF
jgi:ferritin-like metal-binding protein YciE